MNNWFPSADFKWYETQLSIILTAYSNYINYLTQLLVENEINKLNV